MNPPDSLLDRLQKEYHIYILWDWCSYAKNKYVIAQNVPQHFYLMNYDLTGFTNLPDIAVFDTLDEALAGVDQYIKHERSTGGNMNCVTGAGDGQQ